MHLTYVCPPTPTPNSSPSSNNSSSRACTPTWSSASGGELCASKYLPLREDVKHLPLCVFKRLLASEALQLQLENETYPLLMAWLHQSPHGSGDAEGRQAIFNQLAPLLCYHRMMPYFLANKDFQCKFMRASDIRESVLVSALSYRGASAAAAHGVAK